MSAWTESSLVCSGKHKNVAKVQTKTKETKTKRENERTKRKQSKHNRKWCTDRTSTNPLVYDAMKLSIRWIVLVRLKISHSFIRAALNALPAVQNLHLKHITIINTSKKTKRWAILLFVIVSFCFRVFLPAKIVMIFYSIKMWNLWFVGSPLSQRPYNYF